MSTIGHYLFLGLDYLLAFVLLGAGSLWGLMPRCGETEPVIPDTPGLAMVRAMGPGWNLGNTLESFDEGSPERNAGTAAETAWGNPVTTQAMVRMVKDAGFTCVRVPVTWSNHLADDVFTVDPAWMDRVQEIVDYAYGIGLYVILNMHHDDYIKGYIPDRAHEAQTAAQYTAIWAQIAARFRDYDERLLFEAFNEPRVKDSLLEWAGGTPAQRNVVNRLHAAFVETVRAAGGNNATRWLMLPTYAASREPVTLWGLRLPGDDRLIVSIHAYYPFEFAMDIPGTAAYGEKERQALEKMLGRVYDYYVKKGVPVYLGEFGAIDKNNLEDRVRYTSDYVEIARRYGMQAAWWDNGLTIEQEYNGASFLLLDRRNLRWAYPEIVEAITGKAG